MFKGLNRLEAQLMTDESSPLFYDTLTQLSAPSTSLFFERFKRFIQHDLADKTDRPDDLQEKTSEEQLLWSCADRRDWVRTHLFIFPSLSILISGSASNTKGVFSISKQCQACLLSEWIIAYLFDLLLPHNPSKDTHPRTIEFLAKDCADPSRHTAHSLYV